MTVERIDAWAGQERIQAMYRDETKID